MGVSHYTPARDDVLVLSPGLSSGATLRSLWVPEGSGETRLPGGVRGWPRFSPLAAAQSCHDLFDWQADHVAAQADDVVHDHLAMGLNAVGTRFV